MVVQLPTESHDTRPKTSGEIFPRRPAPEDALQLIREKPELIFADYAAWDDRRDFRTRIHSERYTERYGHGNG